MFTLNFARMRQIDSWIGRPLLALCRILIRSPECLGGDDRPTSPPDRIICAKFIGIGSVVLSLPLLQRLKASGSKVAFWTFPGPAELIRVTGLADEVWIIDPNPWRFLSSLWRTVQEARRFKANVFLDMEPTANFSALLSVLSGTPVRAGFMASKPQREAILTHRAALAPEHHMIEHLLRLGSLVGLQPPRGHADLPRYPELSASKADPSCKQIVININASDLSWHRLWPDAHWVALCRFLLARDPSLRLLFPGGRSERARVQSVIDQLGLPPETQTRVSNVAGTTTLSDVVRIMSASDLVITVDSGIMHLAGLASTPIIALFGPETPTLFAPRSSNTHVIWAELPCSPCLTVAAEKITACRDNQCMKRILPEQVLQTALNLLQGAPQQVRRLRDVR